MKLLLDTHVFLWYITADARLPALFRDAVRERETAQECGFCGIDRKAADIIHDRAEHEKEDEERLPSHVENIAGDQQDRPSRPHRQAKIDEQDDREEHGILKRIEQHGVSPPRSR